MTLIEVIVALVIVSIAITLVAIAFGGVTGAKTRQAAGDFATAVRYTYNLAAINNKVYALHVDLSTGSYHAAPVDPGNECERLLLDLDGDDSDAVIVRYKDTGDTDDKRDDDNDENSPGMFGVVSEGAPDPKPPGWTANDDGTSSGKLLNMISQEAKDLGRAEAEKVGAALDAGESGQAGPKRIKTFRKNQLGKPKKLPEGVSITGIVLREGQEPVTEGTVPILFYPHGYTQRALVYFAAGGDDPEVFTVEIMSLQGSGRVHSREVSADEFAEVEKER